MKTTRKAFTIVELLVVVAIIGILLGIVSVAANGALKNNRGKRAEAMRVVLQQGINAYYAKKGQWPDAIERVAKDMKGQEKRTLDPADADDVFQEIVKASVGSSATMHLLDASGLFVCEAGKLKNNSEGCYDNHADQTRKDYCGNQKCVAGLDFSTAVKKGKKHISVSKMAFGFQGTENGRFRRFWITYNGRTDSVSVTTTNPDKQ